MAKRPSSRRPKNYNLIGKGKVDKPVRDVNGKVQFAPTVGTRSIHPSNFRKSPTQLELPLGNKGAMRKAVSHQQKLMSGHQTSTATKGRTPVQLNLPLQKKASVHKNAKSQTVSKVKLVTNNKSKSPNPPKKMTVGQKLKSMGKAIAKTVSKAVSKGMNRMRAKLAKSSKVKKTPVKKTPSKGRSK